MSKTLQIIRSDRTHGNYTMIDNTVFRDTTLSAKAKGVMCQVLALDADSWDFSPEGLVTLFDDGITAIRNALIELEEHGYLKKERVRDKKGRVECTLWTFSETAQFKEEEAETEHFEQMTIDTLPVMDVGTEKKKKTAKKEVRHKHGEYGHVLLTDTEYNAITAQHGKELIDKAIAILDDYQETSGKKYKNYVLMLTKKWPMDRAKEELKKRGYRHVNEHNNSNNTDWDTADGWCC